MDKQLTKATGSITIKFTAEWSWPEEIERNCSNVVNAGIRTALTDEDFIKFNFDKDSFITYD
jgi:hypothetical protein|tara:strand:- start:256 stop:441 length:186 start_codon:yes stop_codon:yes gene_type:complete